MTNPKTIQVLADEVLSELHRKCWKDGDFIVDAFQKYKTLVESCDCIEQINIERHKRMVRLYEPLVHCDAEDG